MSKTSFTAVAWTWNHSDHRDWDCPGCGNETCEHCFWSFSHCKKCSEGKTDEELHVAATEAGFEFDIDVVSE
jgi:hypothetical protein